MLCQRKTFNTFKHLVCGAIQLDTVLCFTPTYVHIYICVRGVQKRQN